jgi:hypothetical protein
MKKLLFLFLCLAVVAGFVSAGDIHPPGALELPGYGFHEAAVTPDTVLAPLETAELICLWADQYQAGLLSYDEFKTLVAGRITVMRMRDQTEAALPTVPPD